MREYGRGVSCRFGQHFYRTPYYLYKQLIYASTYKMPTTKEANSVKQWETLACVSEYWSKCCLVVSSYFRNVLCFINHK